MNPINILFYALASMIGLENSSIVSRKASISINPVEKTFEVIQEDLYSIVVMPEDSLRVTNELQYIMEFDTNTGHQDTSGLTVEKIVLSKNGKELNAIIKGSYTDIEILSGAGINLDTDITGRLMMMDIPEWNIRSSEAVLDDGYWSWAADKPLNIVMEPFKNIPDEYLKYRTSTLPYWENYSKINQK